MVTTVLVVGLIASAGLSAVAYASIPDGSGVIHGCYKSDKGDLRGMAKKDFKACKNDEAPLDWGQTGPQSPQGPQARKARGLRPSRVLCDTNEHGADAHGQITALKVGAVN